MKNTITAAIVTAGMLTTCLIGCNRELLDTTWKYDTAVTRWPDGTMKTIKIKSWRDCEGEQIQVTDRNGNVYLLSSFNTILIRTND
jgi:hypothetical protein